MGEAMQNRNRQPVQFDPDTMRLTIGDYSTVVSHPALGNEAVLRSYLGLVAEVRGTPIGSGIDIRHDDVVVLAQVLDLSDDELEVHLANLLGVSAHEARQVGRRLRRRHAFAAAAASLTFGGLAFLGATKVSATPAPASPPASIVTTTAVAPRTSTTLTEEPTTTVASEPPTTVAPQVSASTPPADETHTHPTSPDDVQIGDALVIVRGEQPADQSTQIDNAVTYER